jgi:nucleoid DNA-binding protein
MNGNDIRKVVYEVCKENMDPPLTQSDVKYVYLTVMNIITEAIKNTDRLVLREFGTFRKKVRKGRQYKVHGKDYNVPDHTVIQFKPSIGLKKALRQQLG